MKLKGKVIVVTGSTRGIGKAIAEACAREGAIVVISSREQLAVHETLKAFEAKGYSASGVAADVSIQSDLENLLKHSIDTWEKVHVWINNAGLSHIVENTIP